MTAFNSENEKTCKGKVSVIIPTFERFDYLLNAIESVKNQTYKNVEIIVINDGSKDNRYKDFKDDGVISINLDKNSREIFGVADIGYVRNFGLRKSTGEYIAFLDDDDCWLPDKLDKQLSLMSTLDVQFSCS